MRIAINEPPLLAARLLALATSASNCEMRGIRLGDINLYSRVLHIRREHAKNRHRIRTIPMHDEAVWATNRLMERARALGAMSPHHHLMPFRVTPTSWDLDQPMSNSGIRKPWDAVRQAACVPWLRIHDLRHTAITRMADAGVPIPVILSMAGHISTRMSSTIRRSASSPSDAPWKLHSARGIT